MERTVYRMELKKRRAKEIEKNKRKLAIALLFVILVLIGIVTSLNAKAENDTDSLIHKNNTNDEYMYTLDVGYSNHLVTKGSSLWDISIELSSELNLSIHETINLLKDINNLTSDDIYEGQSIIVPYLMPLNMCA